ncbi:CRISPR-associated protein Csx18 [Sodalinema gerasimenkoae]|uniref:CRISPR-associated protein Csx18 n=1 Tax=Sodalinema gerasimenkoae TaxID=2862348 RepID=UPI001358CFDE|nr:CRISPR-associated protein Csx18 [Sodalinema gerasimenkoae]
MYLSVPRILLRHTVVALLNGGITLVILLIAPLGLPAVITHTLLVAGASLVSSALVDGVVRFLSPTPTVMLGNAKVERPASTLSRRQLDDIDRR